MDPRRSRHTHDRTPLSRRMTRVLPITVAALTAAVGALYAAPPLDPPTGNLTHVYKTLVEVEPRILLDPAHNLASDPYANPDTVGDADSVFVIRKPGSYYLIGNLSAPSGKSAIQINASCVTLDLMGFDVSSTATSGGASGIENNQAISPPMKNIVVRNGCVRGFKGAGIDLGNTSARNCLIEDIRVSDNLDSGIKAGLETIVRRCMAFNNGSAGGLKAGIWVSAGSSITDCTSFQNVGDGFFLNGQSLIEQCDASQNSGSGIEVTTNCTVRNNNCTQNAFGTGVGAGILAGTANGADGNNRIEGNNCTLAAIGIQAASTGNFIIRNTCADNGSDWVLVKKNAWAQIYDKRLVTAAADVNGFAANSTLQTDCDANANWSY